jgi:soluble lytic murein transglycosylase-like protein
LLLRLSLINGRISNEMANLRAAALTLLSILAVPATVQAQIYAWRDASGTLVLSDRPLSKDAKLQPSEVKPVPPAPGTPEPIMRTQQPTSYEDLIQHHSADQGIRAELVRAVIQAESAFDPWARSIKGAMGLMQLMPGTAAEFGVMNAFDPAENIRAGVRYLRRLLDRYGNNEELALAAYNAGPTAVDRYGQQIPPYRETRNYVKKIRNTTARASRASSSRIYRSVEVIEGREVPRYTNLRPSSGAR